MNGKWILRFVIATDLLALAAFASVCERQEPEVWTGMFLLATLVALAGATPVRIPSLRTSVSATDPFVFTALAAFGPMPACVVAACGVIGSVLGKQSRFNLTHLTFNLGNVVLSTAMSAFAYRLVGGIPGGSIGGQIWPLMMATTVYFIVNTGMVTTAIVIDTGGSWWITWKNSGLWTAVSSYAGLTMSVGLLWALNAVGPSGFALGIPPCWLLAAFYRTHKERQEEQQNRIKQVEVLNLELEDKVADRTLELQKALEGIEKVNAQLRTTNDRLSEANRAKSEFLANVSHELRTPLNAIIGFSDLLRDTNFGRLNVEQDEFVKDIHESGEHLLQLINDILDLSKVEAGKMEVHPERFDVRKAIREAVAMVRPQAVQKSLELSVESALEVCIGVLDPGMFRQVLVNLLSNAVKFTPAGGSIKIEAMGEADDLILRVRDTGIGVAEGDLSKIFDEFYQVDGSYARNYGGTGLGLALVRRMVEMQGGEIRVQSTLGEGSCFICRFPGRLVREMEAPVPDLPLVGELPIHGGRKIMVVEDNPVNRKLARNVLRSRGFEVLEAASGEEALKLLDLQTTDLVLMDIQLPGMDGLEVIRRLKANPATAHMPVVALTAHAQEDAEVRAREAGCCGYITKPIRLAQFPGQVEAYLPQVEPVP